MLNGFVELTESQMQPFFLCLRVTAENMGFTTFKKHIEKIYHCSATCLARQKSPTIMKKSRCLLLLLFTLHRVWEAMLRLLCADMILNSICKAWRRVLNH